MSDVEICALCGLKIGAQVWTLKAAEQEFRFCCEGCKGIYQMLNAIDDAGEAGPLPNDPMQGDRS